MTADLVRILDGISFVVSDGLGDIDASPTQPTGLFSLDTRFLSTWILSINGERLYPLSVDDLEYFEAAFFLTVGKLTHYDDEAKVSVLRQRSVVGGIDEQVTILNHDVNPVRLRVRVEAASDFADMFEIKDARPKTGRSYSRVENGCLRIGYLRDTFRRETVVSASAEAVLDERGLTFDVELSPRSRWSTMLRVRMLGPEGGDVRTELQGQPIRGRPELREELDRWLAAAPQLVSDYEPLTVVYRRSLVDLMALRFTPLITDARSIPAAGLPWFMSIFGRDSIFTCLQALPFAPDLAATTLSLLGYSQGRHLDDFREEEPGKIVHEIRYGESAAFEEQPHSPYYGAADSTALYLILLDEYERWTGDVALVQRLEPEARAALDWLDTFGDIMGDGYVWYQRRNERTGLDNQCWKDSWDSISYRDGRLPGLPRATCELQGYAYDARIRAARLARLCWNDDALAGRLEQQAADLKQRFNRDFWVADGEYYALALDADGTPVDSLSSNIGHLLWSGIVEDERSAAVAGHLLGPRLFSGWGVRTLAEGEGRYNPIGYHVGTVWPFDNSFITWGLRRYGFGEQAGRISQAIIETGKFFDGRLPEAFAGYHRTLTMYPVEYPTACSPQAWSTGATLLFLRTLLGLEPRGDQLTLDPVVPAAIGRISLRGMPGRWGLADVTAGGDGPPQVRTGRDDGSTTP